MELASVFLPQMQAAELSSYFCKKFQRQLLQWSEEHPRPMPWKESKDPYAIWLSEIILQQTRVAQGWQYYLRFLEAFPTVEELAAAEEGQVMKLWQGLGYYSRARYLHATAKIVAEELGGQFPTEPAALQKLKGVGPYTSAAIASFAYNYPAAVVDGNVYRILARLFAISEPIDTGSGKKVFQALADRLLDKKQSALYNQAMIDFGATHCKPKQPLCSSCPLVDYCKAHQQDLVHHFPIKSKAIKKKDRFFNYLVLKHKDQILLRHRQDKDIWQSLYDFPLWESDQHHTAKEINRHFHQQGLLPKVIKGLLSAPRKQILTHQTIYGQFFQVELKQAIVPSQANFSWVSPEMIKSYAFPRIIDLYLEDKRLSLNLQ